MVLSQSLGRIYQQPKAQRKCNIGDSLWARYFDLTMSMRISNMYASHPNMTIRYSRLQSPWFHQRVVVRLQLQGILVCEPQSQGHLAKSQVNSLPASERPACLIFSETEMFIVDAADNKPEQNQSCSFLLLYSVKCTDSMFRRFCSAGVKTDREDISGLNIYCCHCRWAYI